MSGVQDVQGWTSTFHHIVYSSRETLWVPVDLQVWIIENHVDQHIDGSYQSIFPVVYFTLDVWYPHLGTHPFPLFVGVWTHINLAGARHILHLRFIIKYLWIYSQLFTFSQVCCYHFCLSFHDCWWTSFSCLVNRHVLLGQSLGFSHARRAGSLETWIDGRKRNERWGGITSHSQLLHLVGGLVAIFYFPIYWE